MKKRIAAMLTALALVGAMLPSAMAVDLDKSATPLTDDDKTTVTLRVGANEEHPVSDVVFVLDKSTSVDVKKEALEMLDELMSRVNENSTINVGVVVFNRSASNEGYVMDLTPLRTETYSKVASIFDRDLSGGTNIEAGIRAGMGMLAASSTPNDNKHLVLVTDGVTYLWGTGEEQYSIYSESASNGEESINAGNDMNTHHHPDSESYYKEFSNIGQWYRSRGAVIQADINIYEHVYGAGQYRADVSGQTTNSTYAKAGFEDGDYIPNEELTNHYDANDAAVYMSVAAWEDAAEAGYHLYAYASQRYASSYPWAPAFVGSLSTIGGVSGPVPSDTTGMFNDVKNSILYEIQRGTVTDPIGDYYIFGGLDTVTLTVGGLDATLDENVVGDYDISFNDGAYGVNYDKTNRVLTWNINTPVEQGKAVALSYGLTVDQSKVPTNGTVVAPTNGETTLTYESTTGDEKTEEFEVPEFTLGEKESIPTPDKEADGEDEIGNVATGDIIPFTITTTLPGTIVEAEAEEHTMLIFRDTMNGLELVGGTIKLTINGVTIPAEYYDFEDASTANPEYLESGNTFAVAVDLSAIHASEDYGPLDNLGVGSVVLSYKGKVTAGKGSEVNNEAWVNDSNSDKTPGKVTIETGGSGTLMFTLGGAALLAAAGALFVVNRRKSGN